MPSITPPAGAIQYSSITRPAFSNRQCPASQASLTMETDGAALAALFPLDFSADCSNGSQPTRPRVIAARPRRIREFMGIESERRRSFRFKIKFKPTHPPGEKIIYPGADHSENKSHEGVHQRHHDYEDAHANTEHRRKRRDIRS